MYVKNKKVINMHRKQKINMLKQFPYTLDVYWESELKAFSVITDNPDILKDCLEELYFEHAWKLISNDPVEIEPNVYHMLVIEPVPHFRTNKEQYTSTTHELAWLMQQLCTI